MIDPFRITGPTCISFSGGRTSAYMLWRVLQAHDMSLPPEAKVCFANTGKEDEASLRFVRDCGDRWNVPITWVEYRKDEPRFAVVGFDSASRNGEPFEAVIESRKGVLPNVVSRYCSSELKTRTMHRYLRSIGFTEWDTFVGIRADEPRRVAKIRANPSKETSAEEVHLPLAVAGVSVEEVSAFWRTQPFDLELPNIGGKTYHGNCDLCFLKHPNVVRGLVAEKPARATWWAQQEKTARAKATTGARFADDRESYSSMQANAENQIDFIGHEEEGIPCFCGD